MRDGECAAGAEVVLHVDHEEGLFGFSHTLEAMLHCWHHES
jgi:hypothetical protein